MPYGSRENFLIVSTGPLTDNGGMIAWAGAERLALGLTDTLDVAPRARWPLDEVTGARAPDPYRSLKPSASPL